MRMEQATAVAHVLERDFAAERGLERVLGKVVAVQVRLEEGRHLRIAGAGPVEDKEVDLEAEEVDGEGDDDEAEGAGDPVLCVCPLPKQLSRYCCMPINARRAS
jgi:hypothetical protein